jgi:hypothetical protein
MEHLEEEMVSAGLQYYMHFGSQFNTIEWRRLDPVILFNSVEKALQRQTRRLRN